MKVSSMRCGVAGVSPATTAWEQSVAERKLRWHSDASATGLNAELFHSSAITSNTVRGLVV